MQQKKNSELAKKVFKELIRNEWGIEKLTFLLEINSKVIEQFTHFATNADNFSQLCKDEYSGHEFLTLVIKKNLDTITFIQSCKNIVSNLLPRNLIEKKPNIIKIFTSLLVENPNNIVQLCKNYKKECFRYHPSAIREKRTDTSIFIIEYLMACNVNATKQITSTLEKNPELIVQLCQYKVGYVLLKHLMIYNLDTAKLFTSLIIKDPKNIIPLFDYPYGCNFLEYSVDYNVNAIKQITSILTENPEYIIQLCNQNFTVYTSLEGLITRNIDAAEQFASALATNPKYIIQLFEKTLHGYKLFQFLKEKNSNIKKQLTSEALTEALALEILKNDNDFDLCKTQTARKKLERFVTNFPNIFSKLAANTGVDQMAPCLFYLLTKNGSCDDIKKNLTKKIDNDPLGLLLKKFIFGYNCDYDNATQTQTSKHIKNNIEQLANSDTVNEALRKPLVKKMLNNVFKKEQTLQQKYYTFVHGQKWKWNLLEHWFTCLLSLKNNKSYKDFLCIHLEKPKNSKNQLIDEKMLHEKILSNGGNRNRLQYINWAIFANDDNNKPIGNNSINYILRDYNTGTGLYGRIISIETVFDNLGYSDIYKKYENQLNELEQEHKNISKYGQFLLFAIPKKKIENYVFPVISGGQKAKIFIEGIGDTDDIKIVMEKLLNNHEKIKYGTNVIEFALVKTWDHEGSLNPESGIKVFAFNAADPEKMKAFNKKQNQLLRQITQEIIYRKKQLLFYKIQLSFYDMYAKMTT